MSYYSQSNATTTNHSSETSVTREAKKTQGMIEAACAIHVFATGINEHTKYHPIERLWPTDGENFGKSFDVEERQDRSMPYTRDLTPIERWSRETQMERPWDGIRSFAELPEWNDPGDKLMKSGTDDGIWIPQSFSRKN